MKSAARWLFFGIVTILWITVLFLGLELHTRLSWKSIQTKNPYSLARQGEQPWPGEDQKRDSQESLPAQENLAPPSTEPTPEQYRREKEPWRRAIFAGLTDEERNMSSPLYGEFVLSFDRVGGVKGVYGIPGDGRLAAVNTASALEDTMSEGCPEGERTAISTAIEAVFSTGTQQRLSWTQCGHREPSEVTVFPLKDATGQVAEAAVAFPLAAQPEPQESEWAIPFFVYRNHSRGKTDFMRPGEFHTNNVGFRDDNVVLPKPPGVFRIVCIGASTTEEGETNRKTYPNLLEDALNASHPDRKFDVVNCGLRGMTSLKQWLRFQDYLDLQPDLIIYYDGVNDLCHWLIQNWIFQAGECQKLLRESQFLCYHFNRMFFPPSSAMAAMIEAKTMKSLRSMCDAAERAGVRVALCSFAAPDPANLQRVVRDYYENDVHQNWGGEYVTLATYLDALGILNSKIKDLCAEEELPYIPVAENLTGGIEYFGDICHMRNAGISRKVEIIARTLEPYLAPRS